MRKILFTILLTVLGVFALSGTSYAANTVSLRVETPKSPSNSNDFNINFVALTTTGNAVTVKCFKESPSDGSFSQFGSDIVLSAGGNSDNCHVTSSIVTTDGTYQFYLTATDGVNNVTSSTFSVDENTSGPGTPTNYSKSQSNSCQYVITFTTANDGGKTSYVELYRSDQTSFNADSGSRVQTLSIGSNANGTFTDNVPTCGKTYYYVLRAFDSAGNGSGLVGDSNVSVTATNPTVTSTQGAIPVGSGVLGTSTGENGTTPSPSVSQTSPTSGEKQVLGKQTSPKSEGLGSIFSATNILLGLLALIALVAFFYFYLRRKVS